MSVESSLKELETHLLIASRLSYLQLSELEKALGLAQEVGRMLSGLSRKLKERL
jgi:four helix bundle protein